MKTKYILLVFAIILGFAASNKASGQSGCEECFAPWVCSTFSLQINCNGKERTVEYTVCYYCYITFSDVEPVITSIRGIPVGSDCWRTVKEAGERWILEHGMELCGTLPCQEGSKIFKIYFPVCADLVYHFDGTYDFFTNPDCELKCYNEYEWCWCNCIPGECYYPETCTEGIGYPKVHWRQVSGPFTEGNGQCTYQFVRPGETQECQKFKSDCSENDGFPP